MPEQELVFSPFFELLAYVPSALVVAVIVVAVIVLIRGRRRRRAPGEEPEPAAREAAGE